MIKIFYRVGAFILATMFIVMTPVLKSGAYIGTGIFIALAIELIIDLWRSK